MAQFKAAQLSKDQLQTIQELESKITGKDGKSIIVIAYEQE